MTKQKKLTKFFGGQTKTAAKMGFMQVWQDVVTFGCSSLSAAVSADGMLLGF